MRRREVIFSLLLAVVFLLAAGFFFFTSPFFLTRLLVPWISRAAECPIAVERAEFRPFSRRLILHNFRMGRADKPFLTVHRARGTAQFGNLIRGIIDFADVELLGAELNICRDAAGNWCQYELGYGETEPAGGGAAASGQADGAAGTQPAPQSVPAENAGGNTGSSPIQVRLARSRVEDSRINVVVRDRQRDYSWSFTGVSGEVTDFRNSGTVMVRCTSPFRVTGRDGIDFTGRAEWNGELLLDEEMVFAGLRGGGVFGALSGNIDRHKINGGQVFCFADVIQEENRQWNFRKFRLVQSAMRQTGSLVEFSGFMDADSGKYQLNFQRFLLAGPLLSLFADMKCGIRPGWMRVDGSGRVTGDPASFSADLVCQVDRKDGPAYFGAEKVVLPDFQLKTEQNIHFDMRTGRADFRKALVQVSSGGRQILAVSKVPEDGSVKAGIDGFDLKLLQFLIPDAHQFGIIDGFLSGTVSVVPGEKTAIQTCDADLRFTRTAFRVGDWKPESFDAVVAGKFAVPPAGGPVQVQDLQMTISDGKEKWLTGGASGSVSLFGRRAELAWRASGETDRMLSALRFPGSADIKNITRYFSPSGFDVSGTCVLQSDGVELRKHDLQLKGRSQSVLKLTSDPRFVKWASPADGAWHLRWQTAFPADLVPKCPEIMFSAGRYSGKGIFNVPGGGDEFTIRGEVDGQSLAGNFCGFPFQRISGGAEFSFLRNRQGEYVLNRSAFYCRSNGKPALRLEGTGNADPADGTFQVDMRVRYINEHLLNIFLPGRIRSGQFSGRSRIGGDYRKMNWAANGYFAVDKLRTPGAARPVDGNLQYAIEQKGKAWKMPQCTLVLNCGGRTLADLRMKLDMPENADMPVKIQLSGSPVDLSSLYEHIGSAEKAPLQSTPASVAASTPAPASAPAVSASAGEPASASVAAGPERRSLQTGRRTKEVELNFRDMSWGGSQRFALTGKLRMQRNRVTGRDIIIDGGHGQLAWALDGMDFPTGMMLAVHGKVLKPLAIGPFASLFFPGSGLNGVVESGEWNLNFRRLFAADWGEDLSGSCKLKFRDVDLPVNAANGPLSRLLLLPVETIVRAEQLIPATWDVRKHFELLWKHKFSAQSPFSRLKFHTGDLHVGIDCGDLQIRQLTFTGEPVSKMDVQGKMRLVAPYELEFNSNILLCGVQAKLPVRGVLNSPQVAAWQVLVQMPGQTLAGWMDIFSPFKDTAGDSGMPFISPFIRLLRDVAGFQK